MQKEMKRPFTCERESEKESFCSISFGHHFNKQQTRVRNPSRRRIRARERSPKSTKLDMPSI